MYFKSTSLFFASLFIIILLACTASITKTETHSANLNIKNGTLTEKITIKVNQKDTIIFNITSDQTGIVHLHGYNIQMPVKKDFPTTYTLEATTTGKFAIAFHFSNDQSKNDNSHSSNHKDNDHEEITETHLGYLEIWPN